MELGPIEPTLVSSTPSKQLVASAGQGKVCSHDAGRADESIPISPSQPVLTQDEPLMMPTRQDWERLRPYITRLYKEDKLSINQVVGALRRINNFRVE